VQAKKTTVWLSDEDVAALRHAARVHGRSQSDLIREGVRIITRELSRTQSEPADVPPMRGTRRQRELLLMKSRDMSPADAARRLGITEERAAAGYREVDEWIEALYQRDEAPDAADGTL
jgi:hypothetical protein